MYVHAVRVGQLDEVAGLARAHAEHDRALGVPIDPLPADLATRLEWLIFRERALICYVAEDAGRLAGYVSVSPVTSTWRGTRYWLLDCLYVTEPLRRKGFGAGLFAAVRQAAGVQGVSRIRWTSPAASPQARAFADAMSARYPEFRVTEKLDCTLPVEAVMVDDGGRL